MVIFDRSYSNEKVLGLVFIFTVLNAGIFKAHAEQTISNNRLTLSFSDGRNDVHGIKAVNQHLLQSGRESKHITFTRRSKAHSSGII